MLNSNLTGQIIAASFEIHTELGPGLLEKVYQQCLYESLLQSGLCVKKECAIPVVWRGTNLQTGFKIDLLVENKIVIEIKSVSHLADVHLAQILTYMRLGKFKVGLLINFNVAHLKDGIKRVINSR